MVVHVPWVECLKVQNIPKAKSGFRKLGFFHYLRDNGPDGLPGDRCKISCVRCSLHERGVYGES